jgi:biotin transport system permease protein
MAGKFTRPAFSYRVGYTVLHRAPAGLKLLCVIGLSAAAFFSVYGLAASCGLLLCATFLARTSPRELLRRSKPLVFLSVCIIAVKLQIPNISVNNFIVGIIAVARVFVPFAAASLLFTVTTMGELRSSLAKAETRLKGKHSTAYFSLAISLMLGFIPRFFHLWELSNMACRARSCNRNMRHGAYRGLRRMVSLIPLVTERMMEAAAETALALESRGLDSGPEKE